MILLTMHEVVVAVKRLSAEIRNTMGVLTMLSHLGIALLDRQLTLHCRTHT